jgi:nitrogen fixation/metabolism regulation signal transduction histidine kinase
MNIALAVFTTIGAVLLLMLALASANTALFERHFSALLLLNGLSALALVLLVGWRLITFWREYQAKLFGSRIKWRLLLMLILMAVMPAALVYAVSVQFAERSIDSWFDVRVDKALEDGLDLGRSVLDNQREETLRRAREIVQGLDGQPVLPTLNTLRTQAGVGSATVLAGSGWVLAHSSDELDAHPPSLPSETQRLQSHPTGLAVLEGESANRMFIRALVPMPGLALSGETRLLQVLQPVPADIASHADSVANTYRTYQSLQLSRSGFKQLVVLTLSFTLLLTLFTAVAFAFFLAERLTRPLRLLAEGTQAVGAGDFTPRMTLESHDELGALTQSFGQMTRQLGEARLETERNRRELENTSAYLESVLAHLSAGVLAFDRDFRLRAANRGALTILGEIPPVHTQITLADWPCQGDFARALLDAFQCHEIPWQRQMELSTAEGVAQTLLVRGSTLPMSGGYVVVFDDITQIIAAERTHAWGEVARRLAHEIKNPLTPIQLSAERLQHRLAQDLDTEQRCLLDRATQTIVSQVEAMKNMVNDFRDYARTPPPQLEATDMNALLMDVLSLYEAPERRLRLSLTSDPTPVLADAGQLRQVLHNLLKNALEAAGSGPAELEVISTTTTQPARLKLTIADRGCGFAASILSRACEPYVTTKPRGTGLGLAIVKKIIDDHRGEISWANREGGGAVVTLFLPLARS